MKKTVVLILALCFLLAACGRDSSGEPVSNQGETQSDTPAEVEVSGTDEDMFTERDSRTEYNAATAITIELKGNTAVASDSSVKISGSTVTVTKDATHIISGTLDDGMVIVDAPDTAKLQLVLNSVSITSQSSAPLYIKEADKVFVTLAGDNTLTSGDSFAAIDDSNIDGTVFSRQDVTFNGDGSLTVVSPAGHGIVGKDDLVFTGGSYTVTAASHGIQANDSVRIKAAEISVDAGKDGIHVENTDDAAKGFVYISSGAVKIESEGDGISASAYMQLAGGAFEITAGGGHENGTKEHSDYYGQFGGGGRPGGGGMRPGGGSGEAIDAALSTAGDDSGTSMKGIKSGSSMLISGGTFTIDSADDAVHSNLSATISGGTFQIASGDDAIHAEETLTITKGEIHISDSYEGLEALHIEISGGDIELKASDDGLNAAGGTDQSGTGGRDAMFGGGGFGPGGGGMSSNGSILISGGTLYVNASGDGIDSNGTLEITGGHTTVVGPTQGDTATLDYDKTASITGGTFIGTGASNMAQAFSSSGQGVIALSVGNQAAGTSIVLKDKNGTEIVSYAPELAFQIVILSTPEMISGETYTITVGSESGEFAAS